MNVLEVRIATVNGGLGGYSAVLIVKNLQNEDSCSGEDTDS